MFVVIENIMGARIDLRQITFKNQTLNVVVIEDISEHTSACATEHKLTFYRKGQIICHEYTSKVGLDSGIYNDKWFLKKQKVYEPIYDEFIALADKLF